MSVAGTLASPEISFSRSLNEKCGVLGVYGKGIEAARMTYYGLWALQHRGQESSGIVSGDGHSLHRHVGSGLVSQAYTESDLERLPGSIAIGHNRYSTSGGSDGHGQPIMGQSQRVAFAHNGNLPSTLDLQHFLTSHNHDTNELNDSDMMAAAIDHYLNQGKSLADAVTAAYPLFTGAFACVAMTTDTLVAFRDPYGVRPLALGKLAEGYAVASESCAFDAIGAAYMREVEPGEMVILNQQGCTSRKVVEGELKLDIFELVYFARPDSIIMGRQVNEVRRAMGIRLAQEHPVKAEVVIPVPDSAIPMAVGYATATGIPYDNALIKNRYIHRTFIRPTQALRERDLSMKLNPLPEVIMGKSVAVIDDSIVRGTTTRKIVSMLYGAGAREVHLLISSPPIRFPDFYGIDTPRQNQLIAATMTEDQICDHVGATSLSYLSYAGMISATGKPAHRFSTSCFNGVYPIDIRERQQEVASYNQVQKRLKPLAKSRSVLST